MKEPLEDALVKYPLEDPSTFEIRLRNSFIGQLVEEYEDVF